MASYVKIINVFVKPSAEGKSRSVFTMPRRENDGCEETNMTGLTCQTLVRYSSIAIFFCGMSSNILITNRGLAGADSFVVLIKMKKVVSFFGMIQKKNVYLQMLRYVVSW